MSGFSYPTWKPDFYPKGTKQSAMLAFYATQFNAVEINMTFRRRVDEKTLDAWCEQTPDGFRFTMKANAGITHFFRLRNVGDRVNEFVDRGRRLGPRFGVVLFQTHPNLKFEADVLEDFCACLPAGPRYTFEPRHDSFANDEALSILRAHNVALCCNDEVHDFEGYVPTADFSYFRFHREKRYTKKELQERGARVRGSDAYVFFRHTDDVACVKPALQFRELTA